MPSLAEPVPLASLRLSFAAEAELSWYFLAGDQQSTGLRSSLGALQDGRGGSSSAPTSDPYILAAHARLEASARASIVRRRLARLSSLHQRVLEAYYGGDVPDREAFGTYAGVASCTDAYRKHRGKGGRTLEVLSARRAGGRSAPVDDKIVRAILNEAELLVIEASAAYSALLR